MCHPPLDFLEGKNGIGLLFLELKATTGEDCRKAVAQLSDGEKYSYLKHHRKPTKEPLPATFLNGHMHTFQPTWLSEFPWMVYSEGVDGVFYVSCAQFCRSRESRGQFINVPYRGWHKKQKCREHQAASYHQESLNLSEKFRLGIDRPEEGVTALLDKRFADYI